MYIDKETLLSDNQAITTTAASENIYSFGDDDSTVQTLNEKGQLKVLAKVGTTFVGSGATLKLTLQSDDSSTFASALTLYESAAIAVGTLASGYAFNVSGLPRIKERYLRAYFTVSGTFTAGKVHVGLVLDEQTNGV